VTVRRTWPDKWRDEEPIFYVPKSKNGVRETDFVELVQAWKRSNSLAYQHVGQVFPKDGSPHDQKTVLEVASPRLP
jgi:hypothetical protein